MRGRVRNLWSDEAGATVVEHAIMVCAVALVIVALVGSGLSPSVAVRSIAYIADTVLAGEETTQAIAPDPSAGAE